jgi:hypothetical protein
LEIVIPFTNNELTSKVAREKLTYLAILSKDSLFYGIQNGSNDSFIIVDRLNVEQIALKISEVEQNGFQKCLIAFNNPYFSLVPSQVYDSRLTENIYQFNNYVVDAEKYQFCSEFVPDQDLWVVYAVPKELQLLLRQYLGNFEFIHYQNCFLRNKSDSKYKEVFVNLMDHCMNIAFFDKGKIHVSNHFKVKNTSEVLYYISLIFQEFDLESGSVKIFLSGQTDSLQLDSDRFIEMFGCNPIKLQKQGAENNTKSPLLLDLIQCVS